MDKTFYLPSLLILLLCTCGRAQLSVSFSEEAAAGVTPTEQTYLSATVSTLLADYERRLLNIVTDRGAIDRDQATALKQLFIANNEKVLNDLGEEMSDDPIGLPTYLSLIERYFKRDGLKVNLASARITGVEINESRQLFQVDVRVTKLSDNFYTPAGRVEEGERSRILYFSFRIPAGAPERARIKTIGPPPVRRTEDFATYLGAAVGFGRGQNLETSLTDGFSGTTGNDLSFGVNILTNAFLPESAAAKNIFLSGGVSAFSRRATGTLQNFTAATINPDFTAQTVDGPVTGVNVERTGRNINLTEEQTLTGVRIALGPAFRIYNQKGTTAFVAVHYAPGFLLSSSGDLEGTGDYELEGSGALNFTTADIPVSAAFRQDFGLGSGSGNRISANPELSTGTTHALLFGLTFLKDLTRGTSPVGLGLSLEYYLPLNNAWPAPVDPSPTPFARLNNAADLANGPLALYADQPTLGYAGVRINVYLKSSRTAFAR